MANINLGYPTVTYFSNSLITGNCYNSSGTLVSKGHNLEDGHACNLTAPTDIQDANPLLGPLANNGGDTLTHALLAGSPAIDKADNAVCAALPVSSRDQRGVSRPQGLACDIGAFEAATVVNQPPVANAGPDRRVKVRAPVMLDGSASTDPDGDPPLIYGWVQSDGTPVVLNSTTISQPTFTAPQNSTVITFTLRVTDTAGLASAPDQVVITVEAYRIYLPLVIK